MVNEKKIDIYKLYNNNKNDGLNHYRPNCSIGFNSGFLLTGLIRVSKSQTLTHIALWDILT